MPYIKNSEKLNLRSTPITLADNPGQLNFMITSLMIDYTMKKGLRYQTINDVIGALECAKLEFINRVVNRYEYEKRKENGDVYPEELVQWV